MVGELPTDEVTDKRIVRAHPLIRFQIRWLCIFKQEIERFEDAVKMPTDRVTDKQISG